VVHDNVYWRGRAFEVVAPILECFKDSKQFLVVGVVVQLWSSQGPGVISNRTNLSISTSDRQDASDRVVGGISFHNDRGVQNKVGEYGRSGEGMLQCVEGASTILGEVPRSIFLGEPGEGNHNVRVVKDKLAVEIGEA